MSKKKENMRLAGGVAVIAVLVALLMVYVNGDSDTVPADTGLSATTTPEAVLTAPQGVPVLPVVSKPQPDHSASGVIAGLANAGTFNALLESTGVDATLRGPGPYTVFVPANSAFAGLPVGSVNSLSAAQKKRLVQYHVVSGKVLDLDAVYSGNYTALSKDPLNFLVKQDTGAAYVNSGSVLAQYKVSNGIVYVISAVLFPPQEATQNGNTGTPVPR